MTEPVERKKTYQQRLKDHLCPRCGGKVKKSSPYKTCDTCREYYRNYQASNTDNINYLRKKLYSQRIKKGLCPRCGTLLKNNSKTKICKRCLEKNHTY